MIVADPWLLQLATESAQAREVAARLMRCQVRTYRLTGHVLVWAEGRKRSITVAAMRGNIPLTVIHCLRCDHAARCIDWVRVDDLAHGVMDPIFNESTWPSREYTWTLCAAPCPGDKLAVGLAAILSPSLATHEGE